jgi:hypothetical protein
MFVNSNVGKIDILEVDSSTIQTATETTSDWQAGDKIILACLEGNDWNSFPVKEIVNYPEPCN